jgi:hypothetical protein
MRATWRARVDRARPTTCQQLGAGRGQKIINSMNVPFHSFDSRGNPVSASRLTETPLSWGQNGIRHLVLSLMSDLRSIFCRPMKTTIASPQRGNIQSHASEVRTFVLLARRVAHHGY